MSNRWKPAPRKPAKTRSSWLNRKLPTRGELKVAALAGVFAGLAYATHGIDSPGALIGPPPAVAASRDLGSAGGAVRVIDGDTFDYGGERIRIADIDTPELRARCEQESRLAKAATNRLRTLLAAGPFELKRLGRDEDRYGRKLRIVTRAGRSLGDVLVSEGLARTWTGRREPWC